MSLLWTALMLLELAIVLLFYSLREEVQTMEPKKTITRENLLTAETKLEVALAFTRGALKLCEPEGVLKQKEDLDAANVAGTVALNAVHLLKGN